METFPNGDKKVREIIQDWKIRYKDRSAMMDELRKI